MKTRMRKSKEVMVSQWLARNKRALGVPENAYAADMKVGGSGVIYWFEWMGIRGEISCFRRVHPTSLIIYK